MADDDRAALIASASRLGLTPVEWGGLMNYESGLNPARWGGSGGRHVGLIQFGPDEQRQFGVTGRETFQEQLPKAEAFLLSRGYKPGMGLLQAYSTVNAGSPNRFNASDAKNGGMPGTVAEKVANQFGPHFKKAAAFLGGEFTPTMPAAAGSPAQSGRFGVSGVEPSQAAALMMATPSEPVAEKQTDVLALIAPLLQSGMQAASPQAVQVQPAPRQAPQMAPAAPAAFDASRFWSLLKR